MPLNGSGTYSAPASSWNPATFDTVIDQTDWAALLADLSTAMSTAMFKDGQATPTANIPMGGFKLTGLAAATTAGDAVRYEQVSALLSSMSAAANSLAADVDLSNTGTFFDGPSVAQGTSGTWFASGTVTLLDTAGAAEFFVRLWDGTTTIASGYTKSTGASAGVTMSLSGFLASPVANLRMSVRDITSTSGKIKYNSTGLTLDSTITVLRIG